MQTLQVQSPVRSNVKITLRYLGRCGPVKRFCSNTVEVLQQHCGGNTVSLFKGGLKEKGEETLCMASSLPSAVLFFSCKHVHVFSML